MKRSWPFLALLLCLVPPSWAQAVHPEWRALLASPGFQGQPVKGVYFFPGEGHKINGLYTTHPAMPDDLHWNSDPLSRSRVLSRMEAAYVKTVVMSYWSHVFGSPMLVNASNGLSMPELPQSILNHHLVIMPAVESGGDPNQAGAPHFSFGDDFPHPANSSAASPGLVQRIIW